MAGDGVDAFDVAAWIVTQPVSARASPAREAGDWSMNLPSGGCECGLCGTLASFLEAGNRRTFEWPPAMDGSQHVYSRIDAAELPVTHMTRRQGRPLAHAHADGGIGNDSRSLGFQLRRARNFMISVTSLHYLLKLSKSL